MKNIFINNRCLLFAIFATLLLNSVSGENQNCQHSKKEIIDKLIYSLKDVREVSQIIHFLTKQEETFGSFQKSPSWMTLCNVYDYDEVFISFAHLLTDKEEGSKTNEHIDNLYEAFYHQKSIPSHLKFADLLAGSAQSIEKILQSLSPTVKAKILKQLPNIYALQTVGAQMSLKSELLAAVYLSWETYRNIYRWWNHEISGRRASKNILDSFAAVGGGAAGASLGAGIGSIFGPVGSIVGAGIGGITGSFAAQHYAEKFTEWFFDLPKTEALEIAYDFLGVHHTASNSEINKAFRALSMRYHPDKRDGSKERFMELQYYMVIIRAARGE